MTRTNYSAALLGSALFAILPTLTAQERTPPPREKPDRSVTEHSGAQSEVDLIEQLGAEDAAERQKAEAALRAKGEAAREMLEAASEGHEDPEVRWRARRILRGLEGRTSKLERSPARGDADAPPAREDGDPKDNGGFGDLEARISEMQRQMDEMMRGFQMPGFQQLPEGGIAHGTKLELGPNGVRVELQAPKAEGGTETKVYEAPNLDAFKKEYPEIAKQYFGGGGRPMQRWFGNQALEPGGATAFTFPGLRSLRGGQWAMPQVEIESPLAAPMESTPPAPGERLGVRVAELDPAVRRFLGVDEGVGLLVDSVDDGSLAQQLGMKARDVVTMIGEQTITGPADVRAALREIKKGEPVTVVVNRNGESATLHAKKTEDVAKARKLERVQDESSEHESVHGDSEATTERRR